MYSIKREDNNNYIIVEELVDRINKMVLGKNKSYFISFTYEDKEIQIKDINHQDKIITISVSDKQ